MDNNTRELTLIEKTKQNNRHDFLWNVGICVVPLCLAVGVITLFSLFMTGNFYGAFAPEESLATVGRFVSNFLLVTVLFLGVYFNSRENKTVARDFFITLIMCVATYVACLASSGFLNLYAMPIALVTVVLIVLMDKKTAILATVITAVLISCSFLFNSAEASKQILSTAVAAIVCNTLGAVSISFFANCHHARLRFLIVSASASLTVIPFVIVTTIAGGEYGIKLLWNVLWACGSNLAAILVFMPLVAVFEGIFNIADDFRLSELCSLNNPLLKRLASEAPGTFNHSLVVGTLAEACATAIGENQNLARCAAYYHDIGKLKAPVYFSENQSTYNPHDELIPEVSVSMITSHTVFGEILAKQYRLPTEIVAICRQHHGTTPVSYFYRKALTLTEDGDLAVSNYKYSGPKPQTKVAAIIMIVDTIEAALRAFMPDTKEEFEKRINMLVDDKLEKTQFDECPITMNDISRIRQTIIDVLPGIYHSRISYEKSTK